MPVESTEVFLQKIADRNAAKAPEAAKTDEERIEAVMKTPFFMNSLSIDPESDEVLSALQTMQFEGTPAEVAENFKAQGNNCYMEGKYRFQDAIVFYTKGILVKCGDNELESALYSNRAAVHLSLCKTRLTLANFRSVLNDCSCAIKLNPNNVKAYYRSTRALYALDRCGEGIDCCHLGLEIDPENENLKYELQRLYKKKDELQIMERKRTEKAAIEHKEEEELTTALNTKGYRLAITIKPKLQHPLAPTAKIQHDASGLKFTVVLCYPEYQQSDFISEFHENDTFYSHFQTIFAEPAPWDIDHKYGPENFEWFFETHVDERINSSQLVPVVRKIHAANAKTQSAADRYVHLTLGDVLCESAFTIVDGICVFIVLVRDSEFAIKFKKEYRKK